MKPEDIKMIITAIGGVDTYKTIPYLMDDQEFIEAVKHNPKIPLDKLTIATLSPFLRFRGLIILSTPICFSLFIKHYYPLI